MYEYRATVLRVKDADTIEVKIDLGFNIFTEHTVRMLGIDAWETKMIRGANEEEVKKGKEFKEIARRLMEGREVILSTHKDSTDKYGRYLAIVTIAETNLIVNEYLLKIGASRIEREES